MSGKQPHVYTVSLSKPKSNKMWHLVAGGVAGGVSRTLTSPLERLKILRQCSTSEYKSLNMLESLIRFYRFEGLRGFFKGNGSNVLKVVPFTAIEFFTFAKAKDRLPEDPSKLSLLICGSVAGTCATVITYPIDLVKTALSIKLDSGRTSIKSELQRIYIHHGLSGCYKGVGMSLVGIAPFIGFKMATFDILKRRYNHQSTIANLALGGISGSAAMFITYPTDLIRRKIQLLAYDLPPAPYTNVVECCLLYTSDAADE